MSEHALTERRVARSADPAAAARSAARRPAAAAATPPAAGAALVQMQRALGGRAGVAQMRQLAAALQRRTEAAGTVQRVEPEEEMLQRKEAPNNTGLPDTLKAGVESLSGEDLSGVRVHRNSSEPAQLNALAYARGDDIHVAAGQEQHLAHEAWHVVQQRQGRVQPTSQLQGVDINDDVGLEAEADRMGSKALQMRREPV